MELCISSHDGKVSCWQTPRPPLPPAVVSNESLNWTFTRLRKSGSNWSRWIKSDSQRTVTFVLCRESNPHFILILMFPVVDGAKRQRPESGPHLPIFGRRDSLWSHYTRKNPILPPCHSSQEPSDVQFPIRIMRDTVTESLVIGERLRTGPFVKAALPDFRNKQNRFRLCGVQPNPFLGWLITIINRNNSQSNFHLTLPPFIIQFPFQKKF
jgi:hypothetical protein